MNVKRDKYLTEAIGECWHELTGNKQLVCNKCGKLYSEPKDFSTWEGFGKLWEWTQKQGWFCTWRDRQYSPSPWVEVWDFELINPDHFADAVYTYLKEKAND